MTDSVRLVRACAAALLDQLLPRFCLGCGRRLRREPAPLLLCRPCRGALERVDPRASCATCARPLPAGRLERPRCLDCFRDPPPQARLTAIWRYQPPLDGVVRALKFGRLDFLAEALVAEALEAGWPAPGCESRPAALVPVPLALPRRLARGFNQAERIAAALAPRLGAPCRGLLERPGWRSPPQHRLGRRQRRANPAVRFAARTSPGELEGPILVVDDVVTTGTTLRAAGDALRRAGCQRLEAWVLAATPPSTGLRALYAGPRALLDSPCPPP